MPRCIYCKLETSGREAEAHAIPEALCQNRYVLPPGAECEPCNRYLSKLDSALVLHRHVWLGIQVLGLAGKKGKPRIDLGWMRRPDPARPNVVRIEGRGKNLLFLEGNRVRIKTAEAPGWNAGRFRRSLHYLGLNYLALIQGPSFVLQEKFDRVRRYVRSPRPGERWVYGEVQTSNKLLSQIGIRQIAGAPGEIIAIQLFSTAFIVDLLNGTEFGSWLRSAVPGVVIH